MFRKQFKGLKQSLDSEAVKKASQTMQKELISDAAFVGNAVFGASPGLTVTPTLIKKLLADIAKVKLNEKLSDRVDSVQSQLFYNAQQAINTAIEELMDEKYSRLIGGSHILALLCFNLASFLVRADPSDFLDFINEEEHVLDTPEQALHATLLATLNTVKYIVLQNRTTESANLN